MLVSMVPRAFFRKFKIWIIIACYCSLFIQRDFLRQMLHDFEFNTIDSIWTGLTKEEHESMLGVNDENPFNLDIYGGERIISFLILKQELTLL